MLNIKIINETPYPAPTYATKGSAGLDLRAYIKDTIELKPMQRVLVSTGIHIELPIGYEAQIRPRSGLSIKFGICMVNAPGTIDSDYRGIIFVNLINLSDTPFIISPGDRIAQMVIAKYEQVNLVEVDELSSTERASQGLGHSGVK